MDIGTWCNSRNADVCWGGSCRRSGYFPSSSSSNNGQWDRFVSKDKATSSRSKAPIWRILWRKIKEEKKRVLSNYFSSSRRSSSMRYTYDPHTYAQNFDDGQTSWDDDAEDLATRSFSARFAVPARIFHKDDLILL